MVFFFVIIFVGIGVFDVCWGWFCIVVEFKMLVLFDVVVMFGERIVMFEVVCCFWSFFWVVKIFWSLFCFIFNVFICCCCWRNIFFCCCCCYWRSFLNFFKSWIWLCGFWFCGCVVMFLIFKGCWIFVIIMRERKRYRVVFKIVYCF